MNQDHEKKEFEKLKLKTLEYLQQENFRGAKTRLMQMKLMCEDMARKRYISTIIRSIEEDLELDLKESVENLTLE